jgi:hypothetical protein
MREENMEDEGKIERVNSFRVVKYEYNLGASPEENIAPSQGEQVPWSPENANTTGGWSRAPIERDLGPRRGELQPERIAAFLAEFTAVSKKYGIIVSGEWDSPDLLDMLPGEAGGAYVQGYYTSVHWEAPENAPTSA